jgi:hypothetical protein
MPFALTFTATADQQMSRLERGGGSSAKRLKAVRKALGMLEVDPRHPGLHTHKYESLSTAEYDVFEAYAENKTPAAFRIFWRYGPAPKTITILAITPHP